MIPRHPADKRIVVLPTRSAFSALARAGLAEEAGLPAGLFNVVTGDAEAIGGEWTGNDDGRRISFTGSTVAGRLLMRQSSDSVKKMSLELGGNASFMVFDDADVDAAVEGAIASKFRDSRRTCVCANRLYTQAGIHDRFVQGLAKRGRRKCRPPQRLISGERGR